MWGLPVRFHSFAQLYFLEYALLDFKGSKREIHGPTVTTHLHSARVG